MNSKLPKKTFSDINSGFVSKNMKRKRIDSSDESSDDDKYDAFDTESYMSNEDKCGHHTGSRNTWNSTPTQDEGPFDEKQAS